MPFSGLSAALAAREQEHLLRRRRVIDERDGPVLRVDGRELLSFCSNDYLGLASDPRVAEAAARCARDTGFGSTASHLVCGHHREHHALEEAFADFLQRPRALLFSSGYAANLGVITALLGRHDSLIEDRLNHASLLDAARLSGAKRLRFAHNDTEALAQRLRETTQPSRRLIAVDGVFSMDGDLAPLPAITALLTSQSDTALLVDDAHGIGVLGEHGRGIAEHFGLDTRNLPILITPLGKALGSLGAIVSGNDTLIDSLIQFARPYIYSTALPPMVAAGARAALHILRTEPERRETLHARIRQFRHGAAERGLALMPSETAIQPLPVASSAEALRLSAVLEAQGLLVTAIRPPTVPTPRLRITVSSSHTAAQIERLLDALQHALQQASPAC